MSRDALGRIKTSDSQNVFSADFEYGPQLARWEIITAGSGSVTHLPGSVTGGEVVMALPLPAGGSGLQEIIIPEIIPLSNVIRGNNPDILTLAISTQSGTSSDVGAYLLCQEEMS